jgi:hypothetical protein
LVSCWECIKNRWTICPCAWLSSAFEHAAFLRPKVDDDATTFVTTEGYRNGRITREMDPERAMDALAIKLGSFWDIPSWSIVFQDSKDHDTSRSL